MLNKYTLQFKDNILEQKYQEVQLQQKRKPLLQKVILLIFLIIIAKSISCIMNFTLKELYFTIGYFFGNVCLIIILKLQPQKIRWVLMIINYIFLFVYAELDEGSTRYQNQLSSAIIVSFQFIVMRTGEFMDAFVQVISFYSFYFAYLVLHQAIFSISVSVATFLLMFLLITTFYENVSAERSKFKLTIIDDKWDEILQNMIIEPCLIFNFNYLKSSFVFKKSIDFINKIESTDELKQFLRNSKVNQDQKVNLENFIFKKVQQTKNDNTQLWNQKLTIQNEKKVYDIYYSIILETSPIVIIKVKQYKFITNENDQDLEEKYQYKYKILIKSILLQLKLIGQFQFPIVNTIFKIIMYHSLLEKVETQSITLIKIDKLFSKLKLIYPQKQISIENLWIGSPFYGQRDSICLILMEVFETMLSKQIHIRVINYECSAKFYIYGILNERAKEKLQSRLNLFKRNLEIIDISDLCITFVIPYEIQSLDWIIRR